MATPRFAVLGCLTLDSVVTASGERFGSMCGGNALYAAAGVAIWDRSVGIVTRAGSDYPDECLRAFEKQGMSLVGIRRSMNRPGLHVAFAYRPDGSRSRRLPAEVLAAIPAEERPSFRDDTHEEERYLAFTPTASDIPASWSDGLVGVHLPQLRKASQARLVDALRARQPRLRITLDAWHEADPLEWTDRGLLEEVDAFLPSEEDVKGLCPRTPAPAAARRFQDLGARHVVIKLGDAGCLVRTAAGETWHVPAVRTEVIDVTGAGDAFCGGFLVGLQETGDPVRAAAFGTVSASFVVEHATAAGALTVERQAADARRAGLTRRIVQVAGGERAVPG